MLLDAWFEVFVWIGNGANNEEKKKAMETAIEYIDSDPSDRTSQDTVIMTLKQGFEPPNFKCHFHAWDDNKWSQGLNWDQLKAQMESSGVAADVGPVSVTQALQAYSTNVKYSYKQLKNNDLPDTVDLTKKELYLEDEEFESVFKMSRAEFSALPKWKQLNRKKDVGLF